MEIPQTYLIKFEHPAQHKPRNEREEIIDRFLARLNPSRQQRRLKPITYARLSRMLQGVPTPDLYPFFMECDHARNFSSLFWWKLKPR